MWNHLCRVIYFDSFLFLHAQETQATSQIFFVCVCSQYSNSWIEHIMSDIYCNVKDFVFKRYPIQLRSLKVNIWAISYKIIIRSIFFKLHAGASLTEKPNDRNYIFYRYIFYVYQNSPKFQQSRHLWSISAIIRSFHTHSLYLIRLIEAKQRSLILWFRRIKYEMLNINTKEPAIV